MASSNSTPLDSAREHAVMDHKVLGHPAGLFVLFFTEMWERFSFYGMRVLLINFLTMAIIGVNPGWEWSISNATALYGTYAALLYLTPIIGGMIADKYWGYRRAVIVGCVIMALGHVCMAVETPVFLYLGLGFLVVGTGFFKPNMTSIISKMYVYLPEKEDSAYTLYYMGVNAGAFFGMMLCGYLGERIGWSWGFGLAAVFLIFGTIQFIFAKKIFGGIGESPKKQAKSEKKYNGNQEQQNQTSHNETASHKKEEKKKKELNKFTFVDIILIVLTSVIGLLYIFNEPTSVIGSFHLLPEKFIFPTDILSGSNVIILIGILLFFILIGSRISRYSKVVRDRMIALVIFAAFTVVFFGAFEQAATSMITFARDFTQRVLTGTAATIFNVVNTLLTVIPLIIVTWVLYVLNKKSFMKIPISNVVLSICFAVMWGLVVWMLFQDYSSKSYNVDYQAVAIEKLQDDGGVYEPMLMTPIVETDQEENKNLKKPTSSNTLVVGDSVVVNMAVLGQKVTPKQALTIDLKKQKSNQEFATGKIKNIGDSKATVKVANTMSVRSSAIYVRSDITKSSAIKDSSVRVVSNSSNKNLKLEEFVAVPLQTGLEAGTHPQATKAINIDYQDKGQALKFAKGKVVQAEDGTFKIHIDTIVQGQSKIVYEPITKAHPLHKGETSVTKTMQMASTTDLERGDKVAAHMELGKYRYLDQEKQADLAGDFRKINQRPNIVQGEIEGVNENEVEITVSWFSILNSFFIIAFSSLFSKWWESKYNPSAAVKYGLGLILMGVGFAILAFGSQIIPQGAAPGLVRVGMIWLILLYLFNTLGELCLSPVGLSYLSKLVPTRMIAFMFGMWYLAIAIGNYAAAKLGGMSEQIQENHGMSTFFMIFALIPIGVGIIAILLNKPLKRLMHGVK